MSLQRPGRFHSLPNLILIIGLIVPAQAAQAAAPRVIKAVPDHGDTHVDPAMSEIRIEFDQDMNPGGWSICGGGPNFPEFTDKPRWENKRVLVVPVRLHPSHNYQYSINCPSATNFRGENGEPAEVYLISFRTAAKAGAKLKKLSKKVNEESVAELRRLIDEAYSYRDLRKVNWDEVFDEYTPKLTKARTQAEFAREASRLLAHAKDVHILVQVESMPFATYQRRFKPNYRLDLLEKFVPGFTKQNDTVSTGRFDDGIGYILITTWGPRMPADLEPAYAALAEFANAPGVIIDVRPNAGGDESLARDFAGCFTAKRAVYSKNAYRTKRAKSGFAKPVDRPIEPNKGRPAYRGKVAVLMGEGVMSSCESFVLMMRHGAGAKLVGEKTFGSSGNPKPHKLPNGVMVALPSWKDMQPDGTFIEGKGIAPDIRVKPKKGDFKENDPVIEAALEHLRR